MKFGVFYELQLPKPYDKDTWDPEAEYRVYQEALDQVQYADELGFDFVFEVEHHFLEEYSHSSAPEIFLAAASQRTKNIRLGHGIVLTPPAYNHPARIAERVAALDLVSNGRVEFGTGESASEMELGGFGVAREEKKAMWEEATRQIVAMMTDEPYQGYEGEYFSMPGRNVVPKPRQKPHPPLWVAASRRETVLVAARMGMGSLGFAFETPEEAAERVESYYRLVREECRPIGKAINPAIAVLSSLMCLDSDDEAVEKGLEGAQFFSYSLGHYYGPEGSTHRPGRENIYRRFREVPPEQRVAGMRAAARGAQIGGFAGSAETEAEPEDEVERALFRAARRGGMIGSPDYVRQNLLAYEKSHLDAMIFVCQAGTRKHDDIMRSLKLFATEVMPEFKERHPKQQKWRLEQLKGIPHKIVSSI